MPNSLIYPIHIIEDHLAEKLEETQETLLKETDELIKQAHSRVKTFFQRHQYQCVLRNVGSPQQGKKQHKEIVHLNSLNI